MFSNLFVTDILIDMCISNAEIRGHLNPLLTSTFFAFLPQRRDINVKAGEKRVREIQLELA